MIIKPILCTFLLLACSFLIMAQTESPLAKYSAQWNDPKYLVCNTAKNTQYFSDDEKQIIYILNLARMNPPLFCTTVLPYTHDICQADTSSAYYFKSLVTLMAKMEPVKLLMPDSTCFESAKCHAITSGKTGYTGHTRQTAACRKMEHFNGECCQYGSEDALDVVVSLLVDEGVASLGHREICLKGYGKMAVSFKPHKTFSTVAVLDFAW